MVAMRLISATLVIAIAINLDSANAGCYLPVPTRTQEANFDSLFAVMSGTAALAAETCQVACRACGYADVGTDVPVAAGTAAAPSYQTAAEMTTLGNSICPTISYNSVQTAALGADGACTAGVPNIAAPAYAFVTNQAALPNSYDTNAIADDPDAQGNNQGLVATATSMCAPAGGAIETTWADAAAGGAFGTICPCLLAGSTGIPATGCALCTCDFFGVPSAAPTGAPTMTPTTLEPTSDGAVSYGGNGGDNDLSGGAIAGIVIGSIVGAALVVGAGVMIGSK